MNVQVHTALRENKQREREPQKESKNYMSLEGPKQVTKAKERAHFILCPPHKSDPV